MTEVVVQLLKMSLTLYFTMAKMHGATEEELDAIYQEEKDKFSKNTPDLLEDV